jgi:hypothetical protein
MKMTKAPAMNKTMKAPKKAMPMPKTNKNMTAPKAKPAKKMGTMRGY